MTTKFGLTAFDGNLFNLFNLKFKAKSENTIPCLRKLPSTKITNHENNETSYIFQHDFNNDECHRKNEEMTP